MSETANEAASEARRHHLYEKARGTWDEEAAETLITSLPHPAADLATKRDVAELRTEVAMLRSEMAEQIGGLRSEMAEQIGGLRSEMAEQIGGLRSEMAEQIGGLRSEMAEQIGGLRSEMAEEIGGLRSETAEQIGGLRSEMQAQLRAQTRWTISVLLVAMGLIEAIGRVG